jgi:hypothetical protein
MWSCQILHFIMDELKSFYQLWISNAEAKGHWLQGLKKLCEWPLLKYRQLWQFWGLVLSGLSRASATLDGQHLDVVYNRNIAARRDCCKRPRILWVFTEGVHGCRLGWVGGVRQRCPILSFSSLCTLRQQDFDTETSGTTATVALVSFSDSVRLRLISLIFMENEDIRGHCAVVSIGSNMFQHDSAPCASRILKGSLGVGLWSVICVMRMS